MRTSIVVSAVALAAALASQVQAVPIHFTYTQTDATSGQGIMSAVIDTGVGDPTLFTGLMPSATLNQKDPIGVPVPAGVVGVLNQQAGPAPGSPNGVHLDFGAGTVVTLTGDDGVATWSIDVPLTLTGGDPLAYRFEMFDDNSGAGGANDATGSPRFAGYIGDDGSGHRHTGNTVTLSAGADLTAGQIGGTSLGGDGAGDDLGMTATIRDGAFSGNLFIDTWRFSGTIQTSAPLMAIGPAGAPAPTFISGVTNIGSLGGGDVYEVISGGLIEDAEHFIDRTHEVNAIPAFLLGADLVRTANDDKDAGPGFQVQVDVAAPADLFLLIGDRVGDDSNLNGPTLGGGIMDWVLDQGWIDTEFDLAVDEGGGGVGPGASLDQYYSVFVMPNVQPGQYDFFEQDDGGGRNMYIIAAAAPGSFVVDQPAVPEPASLTLLGVAGLALLRRRRAA